MNDALLVTQWWERYDLIILPTIYDVSRAVLLSSTVILKLGGQLNPHARLMGQDENRGCKKTSNYKWNEKI